MGREGAVIPAYAGIQSARKRPRPRHSRVGGNPEARKASKSSSPYNGRGRRRSGGRGYCGRGATCLVSPDSQAPRHSRESGNLPHDRHSGVGRNPVGRASAHEARRPRAPPPRARPAKRENPHPPSAQTALIRRSKALIQRSWSAHSVLTECSFSAQKALTAPRTAQAVPQPLWCPRPNTATAGSAHPRRTRPRLPQASRAIMTQSYCVPLRLLLS